MSWWESFKDWFLSLGENYGVNPYIFGGIYVGAIPFFFLCLGWTIKNIRKKKPFTLPLLLTGFFFIGSAIAVGADVSKEEDVLRLFKETYDHYNSIDILVCNAGIQKDSKLTDMSLEDWQKVIDVNLTGYFLCARQATKEFLRNKNETNKKAVGNIIFVSSVHDIIPWAGHVNYAASKGGVLMLMKSLALEVAPQKIRVNAISPGAIKTDINKEVWQDEEKAKELLKLIPYQRIGEPEDVAEVATWLATESSDYVTGTTIYVDGGMTLYPGFMNNG
jgi:glucose 1-dehydrogenase